MQFELNNEFMTLLREHLAEGRDSDVLGMIGELHPADLADILDEVKRDEAAYLFKLIDKDKVSDVLMEMEEDAREELLSTYTSKEIAEELVGDLDSDDATDLIQELPDQKKEEVIAQLEDEDQASDILDLLAYEEGTAGGLMAKELVKVNQNWTIATAIREMRRQAEDIDNVYTIYVVDDHDVLLGRLSLKRLLLSSPSTRSYIRDIYLQQELHAVTPDLSDEKVASVMEKYDLVTVPVVNQGGILLGRITIDDVVDVLREEAERDYQLASGISEDVESRDSVWTLTRARLPWLLIGMAGGILGATVIGAFDIEKNIEMALFIPLIAAMGGNVGVQSAAIVVQGLANQSLRNEGLGAKLAKELSVGMVNGIICSAIIFISSMLLNFGLALSITVCISLFAVIVFAALFGTFVPLALDKYKIDPALATGPFITTANDIIGLIIYFLVGGIIASIV
ncbi:MAG: magnesium transporter [Flavobacteriales bacterium]